MSKKSILYIGGFDLPDNNAAAQRVIANAKAFRDLGFDLFLIGLSKDKESINKIQEYEGFKYTNFSYPQSLGDWYKYLTSIKQFNPFLKNNPDIIIAYNYPAVALEKLRRWTSKKRISLIADCTEWYEAKGNFVFRLIKSFDTFYRMEKVHPKLDGIIAISTYLYDYYCQTMGNVVFIPPLVDLSMKKWNSLPRDMPKNDNISQVHILYAGSPGKGNKDRLDIILKVLSQLKEKGLDNFFFSIIGITESQYEESFNSAVPLNISNNLLFKGRLSHIQTLHEIKKANYFLFLRDNNLTNKAGFPTKFVEAISSGTPVLTNSSSNIGDFLYEGKNGYLLDISSTHSLEKSLKDSLSVDSSKLLKMKQYCENSNIFHYKNFISNFKVLIEQLPK